MANPFFSGRIPPGLADKIDAYLLITGETRSELLIRLLRAEVSDNKNNNKNDNNNDNTAENKNDDVLSDLILRVQKLEGAMNNKSDNIADRTSDNKTDNVLISLAFDGGDDKLDNNEELMTIDDKVDNEEELVATDDKLDNSRVTILQEDRIAVNLNPTQLADLIKIHERKKVTKAKSKKLLDLGVIYDIGGDLILTKSGEATLEHYGKWKSFTYPRQPPTSNKIVVSVPVGGGQRC